MAAKLLTNALYFTPCWYEQCLPAKHNVRGARKSITDTQDASHKIRVGMFDVMAENPDNVGFRGEVAEWLMAADCKSALLRVRWFESSPLHHWFTEQVKSIASRV